MAEGRGWEMDECRKEVRLALRPVSLSETLPAMQIRMTGGLREREVEVGRGSVDVAGK